MSKQLAVNINWAGNGAKIGVSQSKLMALVFRKCICTVHACNLHNDITTNIYLGTGNGSGFNCTESVVNDSTKSWLKNAPKRNKKAEKLDRRMLDVVALTLT